MSRLVVIIPPGAQVPAGVGEPWMDATVKVCLQYSHPGPLTELKKLIHCWLVINPYKSVNQGNDGCLVGGAMASGTGFGMGHPAGNAMCGTVG